MKHKIMTDINKDFQEWFEKNYGRFDEIKNTDIHLIAIQFAKYINNKNN